MKKNLKHVMPKLMLFAGILIMALSFNSCGKEKKPKSNYEAGQIPGLGNTPGNLTGTPFTLPAGVVLIEDITGNAYQGNYWNIAEKAYFYISKAGTIETSTLAFLTRAQEKPIHYFGSGRSYVNLLIPLRNTLSTSVTVTFPEATIIRSQTGDCQNGVLLKKVVVTIPAGSDYYLCLSLYCGNASKGTAGYDDIYVWGVVSDVKLLLDLCNMIKNKKINIEEFSSTSSNDYDAYYHVTTLLQDAVWEITDGNGLTQETINAINVLLNN
ncbi:MAG: hypothetical protein FWE63_05035 [Bacteroidales bacterium]|nr:hypothetical protein [Bacteroidales bacterium]